MVDVLVARVNDSRSRAQTDRYINGISKRTAGRKRSINL